MSIRNVSLLVLAVAMLVGLQSGAYATTADLQTMAQSYGSLMHQWSFEGADISTAGVDSEGTVDLVESNVGADHSGGTHIVYNAPGYDASSTGASTFNQKDDKGFSGGHGDAFLTSDTIAPPGTFSWEVVLQTGYSPITNIGETPPYNLGYVIAHRPTGGGPRGYFLWQGTSHSASGDSFTSLTGDWQAGEATVIPAPLAENNWYYMAGTHTVNIVDGSSQVDLYAADLNAPVPTLSHTSFANPKAYEHGVAGTFGIGASYWGGVETFPGVLDEINLYNKALSESQIGDNFAALMNPIPEPSTFVLLAVGALGLIWCRRRR